jgi:hypothetical protein
MLGKGHWAGFQALQRRRFQRRTLRWLGARASGIAGHSSETNFCNFCEFLLTN